jgi:hypothetical protein
MHAMYPQRQGPEDCLTIAILTGERMRVWAMCELGYTSPRWRKARHARH